MLRFRLALVTDGAVQSSARGEDSYNYTADIKSLWVEFAGSGVGYFVFSDIDNEGGVVTVTFYRRFEMTPQIQKLLSHDWITGCDSLPSEISILDYSEQEWRKYHENNCSK